MKLKLVSCLLLSAFAFIQCNNETDTPYGAADTNDPKTKIPTSVKPAFDHWMRDTWVTLGCAIHGSHSEKMAIIT